MQTLPNIMPSLNRSLLFPTLPAFLDSLTETILEPSIGYSHYRLNLRLKVYIQYLVDYNLRTENRLKKNGKLAPVVEDIIASVREENRANVKAFILLGLNRDEVFHSNPRNSVLAGRS
jgi:hypothetical protein